MTLGWVIAISPAPAQRPDSLAQPPDSVKALRELTLEQLMNVEVTSVSKHAERISQVASAIQVITQEDLRHSGASSLPEALRLATNLEVAQIDSRQWAISARGFNSTTANKLLVLIDGRTVYTPLYSGVFWDVQDVPLADIERIEVISGPGATLWGANAVNGVINVTTKDAKDTQGLLLSGGGGSTLRGVGAAQYGGALGPAIRFRAYAKGFTREPSSLPNGQDATDDWHAEQGGFRLDWDASQSSHVTLQSDLYDGRISQPAAADIAVSGHNAIVRWSLAPSAATNVTAQLVYDRTHRDIPGTFGEDLDAYDVDLAQRAAVGTRQDVVWGVGYRLINDRVANSAALAFLPPHVTRQWFSGFVQDEVALVPDRVRLTLGTKLEHDEYTGFGVQPSARVNWALDTASTLWTAVSRALRTPSRLDRELYIPGQAPYLLAGGPNFRSEEELAYEVGYRRAWGAATVSVSTFYNHYHALRSLEQANRPNPFPIVIGNGQDGESYGAEATGQYRVSQRWRLRAGYTELRVHIWPVDGSTDMTHGRSEALDPERQLSLVSETDLSARLRLDGLFRYVGSIANAQVPAYAELNARLTWRPADPIEVSLVGQHLLHDQHAEFGALATRREIRRAVYGLVAWHL
ncbi:MAG TPA: TonB-dependent receptor [Gemmatimonadales bacterium]|nr:TonB-dependent receptor [Gemmatimonadales bacterium]